MRCIDNEIPFDIPESWEFVRLGNVWGLLSGRDLELQDYNANREGIPYITGASNFSNGSLAVVRWTDKPQVIAQKGDLLITCKGTVGEMAFNEVGEAHIARQIMAIHNQYDLNANFLKLCLSFYIEQIRLSAKGLIPGISREDILSLILPLPPQRYQLMVVKSADSLFNILSEIEGNLI